MNKKLTELIALIKQIIAIIAPDHLDDIFQGEKPYDDQIRDIYNRLILNIVNCLKNENYEEKTLFDSLSKEFPNTDFWSFVEHDVAIKMEPYNDTTFIRNWDEKRQLEVFEWLFTNGVLIQESIDFLAEEIKLSVDETETVLRVLKTIQTLMLESRVSKRLFYTDYANMFEFEKNVYDFIWNLIDAQRQELSMHIIFQKLEKIENLQNAFWDCIPDINEDED